MNKLNNIHATGSYQAFTESDLTDVNEQALYYQALIMAFRKFIKEEAAGQIFTEARLMKAIEAARTLYKNK